MGELLDSTPLLVAVTWRCLAVGVVLLIALRCWARGAAGASHRLYTAAVLTMLALPIAYLSLPILELPIVPSGLERDLGDGEPAREPQPVSSAAPSPDIEAAGLSPGSFDGPPRPYAALGQWLSALYLLGAVFLALRLVLGAWSLKRLRAASRPLPRELIPLPLRRKGKGRPLDVRSSAAVGAPLIFGLARPTILLPATWRDWPAATLRAAVVHEVMHARRNDHLWTALSAINRCVHWFNPLSWVLHRRLVAAAEYATDELSQALFEDPLEYARALLDAKTRFAPVARQPALASSMFASGKFGDRIDRILSRSAAPSRKTAHPVAAGLLVASLLGSVQPVPSSAAGASRSFEPAAERARALVALARGDRSQNDVSTLVRALEDDRPLDEPIALRSAFESWQPTHWFWTHSSPASVAALTLASFGGESIDVLVEASRHRDPVVRRHAVWALGELRRPHVGELPLTGAHLEAIRQRLGDSDDEVRAAAAWTLGEHRDREATESLVESLASDRSLKVRSLAAYALGEMQAEAARLQLKRAAGSDSPTLRDAARGALAELDG